MKDLTLAHVKSHLQVKKSSHLPTIFNGFSFFNCANLRILLVLYLSLMNVFLNALRWFIIDFERSSNGTCC